MSEKCELCGGKIRIARGQASCLNPECDLFNRWLRKKNFARIQTALALLKRVKSGDAVVIEKRDGEWPDTLVLPGQVSFAGQGTIPMKIGDCNADVPARHVIAETFPKAASKWNGGEE